MALNKGNSECTTGLSKRIYDYWVADTTRNGFTSPLNTAGDNAIKSMCFSIAQAVVDEVTANGEAVITTSDGALQLSGGLETSPPSSEKTLGLR